MARGIEELTEMQVTGPVQGGDMVMKPNQAPVGAAALLSKMAKKNTPGIFKLPMPDKEMPDFMKVAAEGVEQQTAKGDTINQMAGELMRQGIDTRGLGMDEIIKIYEETFGSPGDVDQFGVSKVDPSDWRTILQMINSGMSEEQIEEQMAMNTMKNRVRKDVEKVEAFAPEGEQLAYINPEEAEILRMMGGSGEQEPITGVRTFKAMTHQERVDAEIMKRASEGDSSSYVQSGMERISGSGGQAGGRYETEQAGKAYEEHEAKGGTPETWIEQTLGPKGDRRIEDVAGVESVDYTDGSKTVMDKIKEAGTGVAKIMGWPTLDMMDELAAGAKKLKIANVKDFIKDADAGAGWANLLKQFEARGGDTAFQDWLEGEEGAWKDTMLNELKDDPGMEDKTKTSYDEVLEFMKTKHGSNKEWQKVMDPKKYYTEDYKGRTMGDMEELSQLSLSGKKDAKSKELDRQILEARAVTAKERDAADKRTGQGRRYGGGSDVIEEKLEEIVEAPTTTDPRAGQFNVGGTMPYTEDIRTAGVETDVPLGRRFQIDKEGKYRGSDGMDLSEAMKYATLGSYSQLEPFQEYLTRRRKHLGEDEPQWFDDEGNVIYSETV